MQLIPFQNEANDGIATFTCSGSGLQVPILPVGLNAVTLSVERREEERTEGR